MGNVETHDAIDTPDTRNRSLDISRHVNHKQFIKVRYSLISCFLLGVKLFLSTFFSNNDDYI